MCEMNNHYVVKNTISYSKTFEYLSIISVNQYIDNNNNDTYGNHSFGEEKINEEEYYYARSFDRKYPVITLCTRMFKAE